jgi:hypothetical protein
VVAVALVDGGVLHVLREPALGLTVAAGEPKRERSVEHVPPVQGWASPDL